MGWGTVVGKRVMGVQVRKSVVFVGCRALRGSWVVVGSGERTTHQTLNPRGEHCSCPPKLSLSRGVRDARLLSSEVEEPGISRQVAYVTGRD